MKKTLLISFFTLGVTSAIAQLAVISEIMAIFFGNEFLVSIVIGFWLIAIGLGSTVFAKFFSRLNPGKILIFCHSISGLIFLGQIIILRATKIFLSFNQASDLILVCGYLFLTTLPLCLLFGLWFNALTRFALVNREKEPTGFKKILLWFKKLFFSEKKVNTISLVNQGYFYEALGLTFGSLIYFLVLFYLDSVSVAFILVIVNFLVVIILSDSQKIKIVFGSIVILALVFGSIISFLNSLNYTTIRWLFPKLEVVKIQKTPNGLLTVVKNQNQFDFYQNSYQLDSIDGGQSLKALDFALLYHQKPKNILIIGGGADGSLTEVLKYPVDSVYYLEPNPKLINLIKTYSTKDEAIDLVDPRLNIIYDSPKHFIKTTPESFDLAFISLPLPATVWLNNYYTDEFFNEIKSKLKPQAVLGVYAFNLPNYHQPEIENLVVSIDRTLNQ
ncbi:MAG: hypothetical protein WCW26_04015, partial [Candidatus Buchananbacteria bacterium]